MGFRITNNEIRTILFGLVMTFGTLFVILPLREWIIEYFNLSMISQIILGVIAVIVFAYGLNLK